MKRCGNCFRDVRSKDDLIETREGYKICPTCALLLHFCEVCGSIAPSGTSPDDQLHFEEECFK